MSQPAIYSTSGTFTSGSMSAILYPNANASGFVADYMEIQNLSTVSLIANYAGADFLILPLAKIELPGPISSVSLTATSVPSTGSGGMGNTPSFVAYASKDVGKLPTSDNSLLLLASIAGGGSSGSSGGAPTTSKYLLNDVGVGSLTNAVPVLANPQTQEFVKTYATANVPVFPVQLTTDLGVASALAGAGTGQKFRLESSGSGVDVGDISFVKNLGSSTDFVVNGAFGNELFKYQDEVAPGSVAGFIIENDGYKSGVSSKFGRALYLNSTDDTGVVISSNNAEVALFQKNYIELVSGTSIHGNANILMTCGHTSSLALATQYLGSGININETGEPVTIMANNYPWVFTGSDGSLIGPGTGSTPFSQIKRIANATDPHDAVTLGQLNAFAVSSGTMVFGADNTGTNTQECWFQFGSYGTANIGTVPARCFNVIPQNLKAVGMYISCDVGPTGADQIFLLMEGTNPISSAFTLTTGSTSVSGPFSPAINLSAFTNYTVKSIAGTGSGAFGALGVMVYVYTIPA